MPITSINRVKSIVVPVTALSADSLVTIYTNDDITLGSEIIEGHKVVSYNTFFKNLKAYASIESLPEAALPDFKLEDSQTDKLYKTLTLEWKSPRKQLGLFIAVNNQDWSPVGAVSLLNPYGYPYRIYSLLDLFTPNLALELGENSKIGVQMQDVGYGLLTENDSVTIHGSYVEEIFVSYEEKPNITYVYPSALQPNSSEGNDSTTYSLGNSSLLGNLSLIGNQ